MTGIELLSVVFTCSATGMACYFVLTAIATKQPSDRLVSAFMTASAAAAWLLILWSMVLHGVDK